MSTTTVRMDDDLKAEVNAILDSMGLNFNTFVNMASVQLVSQRRIPFEVRAPEPVLPHAGHVAANGVTYRGVDEQGYPVVEVPNAMVLNRCRFRSNCMSSTCIACGCGSRMIRRNHATIRGRHRHTSRRRRWSGCETDQQSNLAWGGRCATARV